MIFVRLFIALITFIAMFGVIGERENEQLRSGMVIIVCFGLVALLGTLLF
ncbi:hypothetical protein [Carnobacterium pleistocenium]|nr:hypothetical protein [Carnobacterium pleistocenium]